jgi:hypothetical protein
MSIDVSRPPIESSLQPSAECQAAPYLCGQMNEKMNVLGKSMKSMSKKITSQGKSLGRVEQKVFNGFGQKINSMENMIEQNRTDNETAHTKIEKDLRAIIKFGATALIMIFIGLLGVLGSIWLQDRGAVNQVMEEVKIDAPIAPLIDTP